MKRAKDLSRDQLEAIVEHVQRALWLVNYPGGPDEWNPDTEWSWDRVEQIAGALQDAGLRPDDSHDDADGAQDGREAYAEGLNIEADRSLSLDDSHDE